MSPLLERWRRLCLDISKLEQETHRTAQSVHLLAVSKAQPLDKIQALIAAGQRDFGENYLEEALTKISATVSQNVVWHFIGRLQSRKLPSIARSFSWVHTLTRIEEAQILNQYRPTELPPLQVCIQINSDNEPQKSGLSLEEARVFIEHFPTFERLKLRGLMTIPMPRIGFEAQRVPFHTLKQFFDSLNADKNTMDTLSMGMSQDYTAAIYEGATIIRVGEALFGKRPTN